MKFYICAIFLFSISTSYSVEAWKNMKSHEGKSTLKVMNHEDGETSAYLHTEGKAADELFSLLSENRHVAKVQNPGLEEVWLGEEISCIKYLKEKNRISCTQTILKPTQLK